MGGPGLTGRVEATGAAAAALAALLVGIQWDVIGDAPSLVSWQAGVATLAAVGAVAPSVRIRVATYVLGAVAAVLYGLLSWSAGGAVDLVVALLLVVGVVRSVGP